MYSKNESSLKKETPTVSNHYFASIFTKEDASTIPSILPSVHPTCPVLKSLKIVWWSYFLDWVLRSLLMTYLHVSSKKLVPKSQISLPSFSTNHYLPEPCQLTGGQPTCLLSVKGLMELPENYHLISLPSICCRVLEHVVYSSTSKHLSDNHIITPW